MLALLSGLLLAGLALAVMKWLRDAFARLDADSQLRVSDLAFDDPTTVKRVGAHSCRVGFMPTSTKRSVNGVLRDSDSCLTAVPC
jgi:hypothetical protein